MLELFGIWQVLPFTPSADSEVRTTRLNPVGRRSCDFFNMTLGIRTLLLVNLEVDNIARSPVRHEYDNLVFILGTQTHSGESLAFGGYSADLHIVKQRQFFFLSSHVSLFPFQISVPTGKGKSGYYKNARRPSPVLLREINKLL